VQPKAIPQPATSNFSKRIMKTLLRTLLLVATIALPVSATHAIEYRSVGKPSILFDTPSEQGKRLFIISAGTPVEVVVELEQWVKIRDAGGAITWIERGALSTQRTVLVTTDSAMVRVAPAADAQVRFEAVRDLVLEVTATPSAGWVQVRHRDGTSGYLRVTEAWGL